MQMGQRENAQDSQNKIQLIKMLVLCTLISAVCGITGCAKTYKTSKEKEPTKRIHTECTYQFQDVEGNPYTATLMETVPKHEYKYENLEEKDGYFYYKAESGEVISKLGVDVSRYQTEIDWECVKSSGIDFAMIRLGFRGYGEEGNIVLDPQYDQHIKAALEAGLQVGVYFFSQAISEEEALEEAQFVLEHIQGYDVTYPIVYDTEEIKDNIARTDQLGKTEITNHCIAFCDKIKMAGYNPMIYANMKWLAFTLELDRLVLYDKWYADYQKIPQCPYEFQLWQYTETGTVPGIEGNVDINIELQTKE